MCIIDRGGGGSVGVKYFRVRKVGKEGASMVLTVCLLLLCEDAGKVEKK